MTARQDNGVQNDVTAHFRRLHEPAFGLPHALTDVSTSRDGTRVVVTGAVYDELAGLPRPNVYVADANALRPLTDGSSGAMLACVSPDGRTVAYASDAAEPGEFQLVFGELDAPGERTSAPTVPGTIEYCSWSPDGRRVLLGVAGLGAAVSGGQGARGIHDSAPDDVPAWYPTVNRGVAEDEWRSLWVFNLERGDVERISPTGSNVWEAAWLGTDAVVAVASPAPGEGAWYSAELFRFGLDGSSERLMTSDIQLGWPSGSDDGAFVAIVEAICSDRWLVSGDLLFGRPGQPLLRADLGGISVSSTTWIDTTHIGVLGQRGVETVAATYDIGSGALTEVWSSVTSSCGTFHPTGAWTADRRVVVAEEGYDLPPQVSIIGDETATTVLGSTSNDGTDYLRSVAGVAEIVEWTAPDGLRLEGVLCRPEGDGPFPLVVCVHGGPVWSYRNVWSLGYDWTPLLVSRGYAVLNPNPRGSSGRGVEFARMVFGDMGGDDTQDFTSAVDVLVERGLVDPDRVGLTGGSYGGYMSAWLPTQDQRWAASVPLAPVTDWYSQHFTSNIPHFDALFLDDDPTVPGGKFHSRSPVFQAHRVTTPCLTVAGGRDLCTPPTQAQEFHQALLSAGVDSELVIYPDEGHGVRQMPAAIDFAARMVEWFERYMPAKDVRA